MGIESTPADTDEVKPFSLGLR
jgi:hypothetical protein